MRVVRSGSSKFAVLNDAILTISLGDQSPHDHILESYLKKGVYKSMNKSPHKSGSKGMLSENIPSYTGFGARNPRLSQSPTPARGSYTKHRRARSKSNMGKIDIWSYFDKKKSQYNFLSTNGRKVSLASPNKWSVYEKNENTGEIFPEKRSCFDKILCAESENHMVNTLGKSVIDSLSNGGASFLFIGKNDKLFLLQLILRLLVDELGSRGTNQFMLTCSKNMASILGTFFGDDDPTLPANTFKVESNLFDLFG